MKTKRGVNTIFIQPVGRGQFIHPGAGTTNSGGCLIPCSNQLFLSGFDVNILDESGNIIGTKKGYNAFGTENHSSSLSVDILQKMRKLYDQQVQENSMPEKNFGFLLTKKRYIQLP